MLFTILDRHPISQTMVDSVIPTADAASLPPSLQLQSQVLHHSYFT